MSLSIRRSLVALAVGTGVIVLVAAGCQSVGSAPATAPATSGPIAKADTGKSGAQLWSETCSHCHNLRSPSSYGPAQWEVAVFDMRVRAHLTGEEQRKITEFLKAASQ